MDIARLALEEHCTVIQHCIGQQGCHVLKKRMKDESKYSQLLHCGVHRCSVYYFEGKSGHFLGSHQQ